MGRDRLARALLLAALLPACRAVETPVRYPDDLWHPNYVRRSKAVARFAAVPDASLLPRAFDLLLDEESNVRMAAYHAIRSLSPGGEDFGYRPYLPADVRIGIVQRWEAWWRKSREDADG